MNIKIENLTKKYGEKEIFKNFSLEIQENKITCLMSKSGFGKTTLLNILLGLDKDFSGNIFGLENKKIGATFQEDRLFENLSVYSNLKFVLEDKKPKNFFEGELEKVLLKNILYEPIKNLSGGMKRRVAIVRSVIYDSEILFLDEPFKGLDEETKFKVIKYIKENTLNKTVVLVTHDEREAEFLDAIIVKLD